jgi:hypothetical protein
MLKKNTLLSTTFDEYRIEQQIKQSQLIGWLIFNTPPQNSETKVVL